MPLPLLEKLILTNIIIDHIIKHKFEIALAAVTHIDILKKSKTLFIIFSQLYDVSCLAAAFILHRGIVLFCGIDIGMSQHIGY